MKVKRVYLFAYMELCKQDNSMLLSWISQYTNCINKKTQYNRKQKDALKSALTKSNTEFTKSLLAKDMIAGE